MLAKPVKWGVKEWCVPESKSKYVWDIEIYQVHVKKREVRGVKRRGLQDANIIKKSCFPTLCAGPHCSHGQFFHVLELFAELKNLATGTIRSNKVDFLNA